MKTFSFIFFQVKKSLYPSTRKRCGDWPSTLPSISDCFVDLARAHHGVPSVLERAREVLKVAPGGANISSIRTSSGSEQFHRLPTPPTSQQEEGGSTRDKYTQMIIAKKSTPL